MASKHTPTSTNMRAIITWPANTSRNNRRAGGGGVFYAVHPEAIQQGPMGQGSLSHELVVRHLPSSKDESTEAEEHPLLEALT